MIRLNDIRNTVIDENEIKGYGAGTDNLGEKPREEINFVFHCGGINVQYDSKEARDKDIELLDKLFDVKSIEYKAMCVAKPELYPDEGGINEESKLVSEGEYDPVKKEEYLTWDYVKQFECGVNAYLPEGSICKVYYEEVNDRIQLGNEHGYIYNKRLFNALKLKKVE